MNDPISNFLDELISRINDMNITSICDIEILLGEYDLMLVPIEDPTNLRFGVDE